MSELSNALSAITESIVSLVEKSALTRDETKWAIRQIVQAIYDLGKLHGKRSR